MVIQAPQSQSRWNMAASISSLEKKPEKGHMPAMARQPIRKVMWQMGMYLAMPPMAV